MDEISGEVRRWRSAITGASVCYRVIVIGVTVALLLDVLSACGSVRAKPVRLGTYVSHLCEAIGPFERDAQRLGRIRGRHGLDVKTHQNEQVMTTMLTAVIVDARHVVRTLKAVGAPDVGNGRALATAIVTTFDDIEKSDTIWLSELRAGGEASWTVSRVNRERLRTSLQALVLVGHQFERLPHTQERQEAMARSPVCQDVFGSVRVSS